MDTVFDAALARQEELRQELKKIEDFLLMYRTLANQQKMESKNNNGTNQDVADAESGAVVPVPEPRVIKRHPGKRLVKRLSKVRAYDNPKPADVVLATVDLIRAEGKPMSRRQIHTALKGAGLVVNGADPVKALGTMLWRSGKDVLIQLDGHGYWLKTVPNHAAGYTPSAPAEDFADMYR